MPDPIDAYADQVQLQMGPFGCVLNFSASSPLPVAPGVPPPAQHVASIRMSLEHLKVMAFILRRQMLEYERESRTRVAIPQEVLNALRIGPEDWDGCWGGTRE